MKQSDSDFEYKRGNIETKLGQGKVLQRRALISALAAQIKAQVEPFGAHERGETRRAGILIVFCRKVFAYGLSLAILTSRRRQIFA